MLIYYEYRKEEINYIGQCLFWLGLWLVLVVSNSTKKSQYHENAQHILVSLSIFIRFPWTLNCILFPSNIWSITSPVITKYFDSFSHTPECHASSPSTISKIRHHIFSYHSYKSRENCRKQIENRVRLYWSVSMECPFIVNNNGNKSSSHSYRNWHKNHSMLNIYGLYRVS